MKIPALVFLGAALFGAVAARADVYTYKEAFSQTHAFSPTGMLRVENVDGLIEVRAWNRNEILIEGEKSAAREDDLRRIDLEIRISDENAEIKVRLPKKHDGWFWGDSVHARVTFRISVPANVRVAKLACVNAGIAIEGIRGPVTAESVNGGITARGLAGDARLNSVNGSISATFAQITAGQNLSIDTVNGGVTVQVPKGAGLTVNCSVLNGGIDCTLPITLEHNGRHHLAGTIGDGRATLKAGSLNGGIHIDAI